MAHQVAHAFDNHNASLREGAPSLLWSGPCLESLIGHGLARIPRVRCDERSGAAPGVSPPRPARRTGGKKVEGATPRFLALGAPREGGKVARPLATVPLPSVGVAPSTVIPAGRRSSRLGSRQRKSSRPQMALRPRAASLGQRAVHMPTLGEADRGIPYRGRSRPPAVGTVQLPPQCPSRRKPHTVSSRRLANPNCATEPRSCRRAGAVKRSSPISRRCCTPSSKPAYYRSARAYAEIAAKRRLAGRAVAPADCQIAAIACSRGMAVATHNVREFEEMGIDIFYPWDGALSGTTEAFSRLKIDALLRDAGWNLTDGVSFRFECALPYGTQSDYVLCDRSRCPMVALEAKCASDNPVCCGPRERQINRMPSAGNRYSSGLPGLDALEAVTSSSIPTVRKQAP